MRPVDNPFFVSLFDDLLIPEEAAPKDASSDTPTYLDYDFKSNKGENSIWGKADRKLPSKAPFPHNTDVPTFAEGGILAPSSEDADYAFDPAVRQWRREMGGLDTNIPEDPDYNYREAMRNGARPEPYAPDGGKHHWPSTTSDGRPLKSQNHQTAWMETFMQATGVDPNEATDAEWAQAMEVPEVRAAITGRMRGFAEGGIMSPDETYLAEQEDGELEEVPPGATAEGVKDDIDIKISEGEIVVPEDVARWHGLKWFMEARNEAKEGLAQMQSEGLIKAPQGAMPASAMGLPGKPSMPLLDTTEAPEMGFADGGTAGDDDGAANGDGKGGNDNGGDKGDGSDAMGGMNDGFGNVEGANTTDGYTDSSGASTMGYDSPSTSVSTTAMSEDEEDTGKPAATVGFAPPDETVQAVSRSFDSARNNVTAMGTGLAGAMGNLAGGRATAQVDPETGLYGTSFSNNPAQALGTIAGMATGISGLGKAAGWGADQMGIGQNNLGFDATNNGLVGAIGAGVDGFGYAGEGVDNTANGEDTMTAMQSLIRRPY